MEKERQERMEEDRMRK